MSDSESHAMGRIVVGVDGSEAADSALRWAVEQAARTGGTVQAVMAWQYPLAIGGYGFGPVVMDSELDFHAMAEKTLGEAIGRASRADSTVTIEPKIIEGYAPTVLTDASAHAELLVVGSRGHGTFSGALLGSVSQHCAHHAKCPLVIVRARKTR